MSKDWRTSPDHETEAWPPGVPYIIGNEGCERFSFYGMKAILYVHMTSLFVLAGQMEEAAKGSATEAVHTFIAGVYAFPLIGAIIADRLLGKYRTIFWLSLVYCAGHAVLSIGDFLVPSTDGKMWAMGIGLALIAMGSGGIKPCVSANVGDQFGKKNWFRVRTVFQWFYFIINFGSFFATLIIPWTKQAFGAGVAFAIPGILMGIATVLFWMGRHKFVHVPARPGGKLGFLDTLSASLLFVPLGLFLFADASHLGLKIGLGIAAFIAGIGVFVYRQRLAPDDGFLAVLVWSLMNRSAPKLSATGAGSSVAVPGTGGDPTANLTPEEREIAEHWLWGRAAKHFGVKTAEGPAAVLRIVTVFVMVSVFWALFDQHSSSWIRQAEMMNRSVILPMFGPMELLPSQLPALNPLMVMGLIPVMNMVYKLVEKLGIQASPLRRMTVGMFTASVAFAIVALLQARIESEGAGNVNVLWQVIPYLVITAAEVMVSVTGLEFAYTQAPPRMKSTIMGFWLLTVAFGNKLVAVIAKLPEFSLTSFFWLFAGLMALAAVIFGARAYFYEVRDFPQD